MSEVTGLYGLSGNRFSWHLRRMLVAAAGVFVGLPARRLERVGLIVLRLVLAPGAATRAARILWISVPGHGRPLVPLLCFH